MMLLLFAGPLLSLAGSPSVHEGVTVYAERLYTSTGEVVENAAIRVEDGKIAAITGGTEAPDGDDVLRAVAVTAGMIDASVRIHTGNFSVEDAHEIQPHRRVAEALDPFDYRWKRMLRSGVTTGLVCPEDRNVIGGFGVVLKMGGEPSIAARTVKADAVVRGAIGGEPSRGNHPARGRPSDFYSRRPTTRMGVEWEWRKAFYDASAAARIPERAFPGSDVLQAVLAGRVPLSIQAWTTQDIRTAVFLKEEMQREGLGEIDLIIDAAAEAWKEPQLLTRSGVKIILPPFDADGRTGPDGAFIAWNVAKMLQDLGVPIALSSHGASDPTQRLARQAGYAMRGGLTFDEALAAVTLQPARMLGVEDRVGTVEVGKDADLVLWSGTPFEITSRITGVLLDGAVVIDPRQ
ncbi:MAG: hypothetical protein E2O39_07095 [Planctomycetota bacterium]|nr:MAG: hypothetical protein E2O39_07095 [Planctomycetota bacterium]